MKFASQMAISPNELTLRLSPSEAQITHANEGATFRIRRTQSGTARVLRFLHSIGQGTP